MQLKIMYQGEEVKCNESEHCDTTICRRDLLQKVILSFVRPQLAPVINRIFEVQELFLLSDVVSLGENQLHHVIRMSEYADLLSEHILSTLGINREDLITAVLFHDVGKGKEVDDAEINLEDTKKVKVPKKLRKYGMPSWVELKSPIHDHLERGVEIGESYNLHETILQAIALHHHVKIDSKILNMVADGLSLAPMIREDIQNYQPEQYAAKGNKMVQVLAILDQICAIERKFNAKVSLGMEPERMEDELVKDLVIGVALENDPRMKILGQEIIGNETVILMDLRSFGTFVQLHSEYEVQASKRTILNTIRSVVRAKTTDRVKDLVGLVGGDEFVVITKVTDLEILARMVDRISGAVKARTGFSFRIGYGVGGTIPENFHEARTMANLKKRPKYLK